MAMLKRRAGARPAAAMAALAMVVGAYLAAPLPAPAEEPPVAAPSPAPAPAATPAPAPAVTPAPAPAQKPPAPPPKPAFSDEDVRRAIERGREYLINIQNPDGSFGPINEWVGCHSALAFMTLAYMGEQPSRAVMTKGLDYLLKLDANHGFNHRQGYALPIRIMGLSYVQNKLSAEKRGEVRRRILGDLAHLAAGQAIPGGWRYELKHNDDYDFSVTQWPILAMREANLAGIEFSVQPLLKARELYFTCQNPDGGWHYQRGPSYGSMTAAGLASLLIITDVLEPASGCPCRNGQSQSTASEAERRIDLALGWLAKNFTADKHPFGPPDRWLYWLYCVERVGIAAGYKYFGTHNWYREGAEVVVKKQEKNGCWRDPNNNDIPNTCFGLLFLYKGRAPILFNKLKFEGIWNAHRRDIYNLTTYIEHIKEQQFHWQVVELSAPLDELHEAPILYISAETAPRLLAKERRQLRAFTDTGGTILFEASCGNSTVRRWFVDFAKEVWPEWRLKPLGPDHATFTDPHPLEARPEVLGINDGMRTFVFFAMDDVSCAWQTRAVASKDYLFKWGINLFTYATDRSPLRAKLEDPSAGRTDRYTQPVKAGPKTTLRIARLQHGGNWEVGANYAGLQKLADHVKAKAGITLQVRDNNLPPITKGGTAVADLADCDVAYLAGTSGIALKPPEQQALAAFVAKSGFLWFEAAGGSRAFDESLRRLLADMGWTVKNLPFSHPLLSGQMNPGLGYNLTDGVEFRQALRIVRAGRNYAEICGVFAGDKLVGVYLPLDVVFSLTGYEAWQCAGYKTEDAEAVAMNLVLYLSAKDAPPTPAPPPAAAPAPGATALAPAPAAPALPTSPAAPPAAQPPPAPAAAPQAR